ncbi:tetratricopeptide repeat protein [Aestuariibacter sp. GS-14]|uniref:glycosyltransferase n=1 Tax=Aestuariibacter sp. GS-14 TaxID=2590670 RepID=UPI0011262423|nr:glycosyltransferase [Aestuariibacter sp. GS-14]TPV55136.1 tetratricopeptide repeat protein [Aestuariibacter sp. GS-14]
MEFESFISELDNLLENAQFTQIIERVSETNEEWKDDATVRLKQADALTQLNRLPEALNIYQQLISQNPNLSWAYIGLGKLYNRQKENELSINTLNEGLASCEDKEQLLLVKASLLNEQDNPQQALVILNELSALLPNDRWVLLAKLDSLNQLKLYDQAVEFAASLHEKLPFDDVLLYRHALALINSKVKQASREACIQLLLYANKTNKLETACAINILQLNTKYLTAKELLNTIRIFKNKVAKVKQEVFVIQAYDLIFGANYALQYLLKLPTHQIISLLPSCFDIFTSAGQLPLYRHLLTSALGVGETAHHLNMLLTAHFRQGMFIQARKLATHYPELFAQLDPMRQANFDIDYAECNYREVLQKAEGLLEQQLIHKLPDVVYQSYTECTNLDGLKLEQIQKVMSSELVSGNRTSLNVKICKAALAPDNFQEKSKFGKCIDTVSIYYQSLDTQQNINTESPNSIPLKVVQFWNTKIKPRQINLNMQTWSTAPGFAYDCFSTSSANAFFKGYIDNFAATMNKCALPAEQSDYFRLCYLWEHGGIYADADDILVGDLFSLLDTDKNLILMKEPYGVGNNFIAVAPKHPVIGAALERAKYALNNRLQVMTWFKTGPGLLISSLAEYIEWCTEHQQVPDVHIWKPEEFRKEVTTHCNYPGKQHLGWVNFMQL